MLLVLFLGDPSGFLRKSGFNLVFISSSLWATCAISQVSSEIVLLNYVLVRICIPCDKTIFYTN